MTGFQGMLFRVSHTTDYHYTAPVAEAYLELRLKPLNRRDQAVKRHTLNLEPMTETSEYEDYFGNQVSVISLPFRHSRLTIESEAVVSTSRQPLPEQSLALSVQEARQILASTLPFSFDYLQPTNMVRIGREAVQLAKRHLRGNAVLSAGLEGLNRQIHKSFEYKQGSTHFSTDLGFVWKERKGVCQDFAHVMLSVLRTAGLPARYVCGYIETMPPGGSADGSPALIGSIATHAWVEVLVPGQTWVALDPTNDCWCGEQHVAVSFGRDAGDAAPVRGIFKGTGRQSMKVRVRVRRLKAGTRASQMTMTGAPRMANDK
ncbi:MAG: transglutaminase family protein [Verrucomicrobia bacterium]|nr:transglutaminase family protein [Verrucomicrobiota bacterium]